MADYRKRLVDMTDEERAEVAPGAPQFSDDYENVDDPLSVQMLEAGLDFTPVGTVKGISDIKDELSSDDPNYLKALGMGAVEAASIIPGAAPVLKGMVKGPLKSSSKIVTSKKDLGFDMGKPYDYDFTVKVEDIIDEWASGDISNAKLRKKLGDLDIKLGDRINPSADPSTLTIQMPDGRVFYGTGDIPSTPRPMSMDLPPAENAARTQIAGTLPTYKKADSLLTDLSGEGKTLDFGAGLGLSKKELNFDTYEPFPKEGFKPDYNNPSEIPSNSYKKITNLNVLNVVPKDVRDTIVKDIGRILEPNGRAVITTRGRDVMAAKGKPGPEDMSIITTKDTYQKGFTQAELKSYIQETLGESFDVVNNKLGAAGVTVHKLPTKGYAEGGAVMDEQMEMAFGDAGERVDPVSGNEVPIGSMPEEVRDDIPAQLSEGEYVVPADVVRFFGVKFFEDLRNDAKMGFSEMQANGRIGGEPIGMEVVEPQDDLDIMFEDSDFEVVDGYAEGGVVGAASDILSGQAGGLMEYRPYKNPAGEEITIMFFNGMPMSLIPEGYVPVVTDTDIAEAEAAEAGNVAASSVAEQQPVYVGQAKPSGGDSDDITVDDMPKPVAVNYKELTPDELRDMVKQGQELAPRTVPLIASLLNPFAGLAIKAAMWHQSTQVENELKRRLKEENLSDYDKTFYEDLLEIQEADKPSLADKLFKDQSEAEAILGRDYLSPAQRAAKAVDAQVDAEAIDASVRAAFAGEMPTGMAPVAPDEPIEITSLNDEPGARDYKGPLAGLTPMLDTKGGVPEPYVYQPEAPTVKTPETDNASAFLASEDKIIADQRRDTINKLMAEKKAEREAKIAEIDAQIEQLSDPARTTTTLRRDRD